MKTMEGLATSSTAMVSRLRCSTLSPLRPGMPTRLLASVRSSTQVGHLRPQSAQVAPCRWCHVAVARLQARQAEGAHCKAGARLNQAQPQ